MSKRRETPWPFLGSPTGTHPNRPTPEGGELGAGLARFVTEELAKQPGADVPCEDCAFRLGTVPNRCAGTLMDALKCLMERRTFSCHIREGEPVCAGFAALLRSEREP